jgi:hypothetical protein
MIVLLYLLCIGFNYGFVTDRPERFISKAFVVILGPFSTGALISSIIRKYYVD